MNNNENTTKNNASIDAIVVNPETITEFTRAFVESLDPKVKKVDSDGDIDLFCYTTCEAEDPVHIKACRGLVFNKDELVLKAFSYSPDYTADDYDQLNERFPDTSRFTFFDSYEGALIRVFYAGDDENKKWFISTHRRLDAFRSKWSGRTSFGECFATALEHHYSTVSEFKNRILASPLETEKPESSILNKFISTLDTSLQYMFLIQHNRDNRIVCDAPEYPHVFHVGTFTADGLDLAVSVDLPYPKQHTFDTMDDAMQYVEESVDATQLQGVIMYTDTDQIKIMNRQYKYLFDLRGNESSVKYRYLQLRMDADRKNAFQELYSTYQDQFDQYEDTIYEISNQIFNAYLDRYIHKKHVTMPPEEYAIMRECHSWHISDRANHHISFPKVIEVLNRQDSSKINKMIRRYLNNQRLKTIRVEGEAGEAIEATQ